MTFPLPKEVLFKLLPSGMLGAYLNDKPYLVAGNQVCLAVVR